MLVFVPTSASTAISTPELYLKVVGAGFAITKRTQERHLERLHRSPEFRHLHRLFDGKCNRWGWTSESPAWPFHHAPR